MGEVLPREEVASALEARRELGPAYEDEIVDALARKLEARIDERVAAARPRRSGTPFMVPVALGSLGMGIPLTAIAGGTGGAAGIALTWIGIAVVNLAAAIGSRR